MTTVDRTAASDATFAAVLARIEAAQEAPEAVRERVAASVFYETEAADYFEWPDAPGPDRRYAYRLADAALAAIRTPTTEEHNR